MNFTLAQHRKDVQRLRECQLSISLEGVADRVERLIEAMERMLVWYNSPLVGREKIKYGEMQKSIKAVLRDAKGE